MADTVTPAAERQEIDTPHQRATKSVNGPDVLHDNLSGPDNLSGDGPSSRLTLTAVERLAALTMHAKGTSITAIAKALDRSYNTIQRILSREEPEYARHALGSYAADWVEDWRTASTAGAAKGNHAPAMDAMVAAGLIESPRAAIGAGSGISITVGIALPGLVSAVPEPVLAVQVGSQPIIEGEVALEQAGETLRKP